ncbi:zinc finger protein ZAT7-like [Lolium perenne]|uniref:zinc finger protein ZAT7-like n=1 Tax=Lolium perenne TaxID=4522 RepID=UPI0021F69555|nr:zinc finger protein ZAT8-like [Lolium perenne]
MVSSMNHNRDQAPLSLSLSLGAVADRKKKLTRAAARNGEGAGEFACKTCGRSFPTFQALGGHRTSHLRGRHGLALALAGDHYSLEPKKTTSDDQKPAAVHQCHVCGLTFEMGQALGGHMRRHREEAGALAQAPPVLLQLFV